MKGEYEQTEFAQRGSLASGRLIHNIKIIDREQITAQYIIAVADTGDSLREIKEKLPNWVKKKNDVRGVLNKLIRLDIIYVRQTLKGAEIDEILPEAKEQAKLFLETFEKFLKEINSLGNNYCYYL